MSSRALAMCVLLACTKAPSGSVTTSTSASASASASVSAVSVVPSVPSVACAVGDVCATAERPPGVVIDHLAASSGAYVGSPSIAVLADGSYVASHDFFGPSTTKDKTIIFGSSDRGEHWSKLADVDGQWWSTLFVLEHRLYLFGTSKQFGHIVIRRSTDGGRSWSNPGRATNGLLTADAQYHCAPGPVLLSGGRVWRAFEQTAHHPFTAFVMSAPATSDLMNTLTLVSSPDLTTWTERAIVLHHDDRAKHGFHYVDWLFDGDDIIAVSRTAYDDDVGGAHSAHDANYLTFHRIKRFRDARSGK